MNKNLLKTFFVAVGLAAGTSAWAQEATNTYQSSESAYVDGNQPDVNLNGKDLQSLLVYNCQYRDWGANDGALKMNSGAKAAFYKFSLADINAEGTITNATLKITATGTGDCYKIRILGYNPSWDASKITYSSLINEYGDISGNVNATGSFQPLNDTEELGTSSTYPTTFEVNVLDYLRSAIEADKEYVSFAVAMNLQRELSVNTTAELSITTTSETRTSYTIKFQDESGNTLKADAVYECSVGDEVTASADDMADFFSEDETKKYRYASGNETIKTVDGENTITLVFKELPQFTVTINAVDKDGETLAENIASASGFEGDEITAYYHKYIKVNDKWYVTETKTTEPFLGVKATEAATEDVIYEPSNVYYFIETEDMIKSSTSAWAAGTDVPGRFSNGEGYRLAGNRYAYTEPLTGGTYKLTIFSRHTKDSEQSLSLYVRDAEGTLTDLGIDYVTTSGTKEHEIEQNIVIPDGCSLVINNDGEYNSNVVMDYLYLVKASSTVSIVYSDGLATYTPAYDLDFTNAKNIAAYTATISGDKVNLTRVNTVAAGEGVLIRSLKGGDTEEEIPVAAETVEKSAGNMFVGTLTEIDALTTEDGDAVRYILNDGAEGLGFYRANNQKVGAGKAYLSVPAASAAKISFFSLDGTVTAIEGVEAEAADGDKVFYNLSGQRVENPAKGLYIVNGKKVIIK